MKIFGKNLAGFVHYRRKEVIQSILDSSAAQSTFAELAEKKNQPKSTSRQKANTILLELSSAYSVNAFKVSYWIVRFLKRFMFDDIILYGDEIKEIHQLTADGKIIFYLPNHKSHMDYLLISYNLFNGEIAPPHIAAGVNLSFFPVGGLFRRAGAYFIRRKIAGNFLYKNFLQYYFDWMLSKNISQEFYMEGGRSRDGKIRAPQSGIFTLFVEQILARNLQDRVYLVPTAITYDRLPEMKSMIQELKGSSKEKESIFSIIGSASLLCTDHGHVHIQLGKPIALSSLVEINFSKKNFKQLSRKIFKQVQKQKTITVSSLMALVLLASQHSVDQKELFDRVEWMMNFLKPCSQHISADLANIQKQWSDILKRFESLGWYSVVGSKIHIGAEKRMEMNYYKNDLLPVLMPFFQNYPEETRAILLNEFPYAKHTNNLVDVAALDTKFLDQVIQPILSLYEAVKREIDLQHDQKKILTSLIESKFMYGEMLTIEAVKSASAYFHENSTPKPVVSISSSSS